MDRHGQRAILAAAIIMVSAACSEGTDESVAAPSTNETATAETTATTASTTTATEPTTTTTSVEDVVRDVHTQVMTEMFSFDSRVDGYEPVLAKARELTTGPLLRRVEEDSVVKEAANEFTVASGYESNIVSVEVNGDRAIVVDCSRDTGELYDAEGNRLI